MIANLESRFREAVQDFWNTRESQARKQRASGKSDAGARAAVTGGKQMGALENLLKDILVAAGLDQRCIKTHTAVEVPGYYRAEKQWDLLVVVKKRLLMAIELKSHVGPSFGNNVNNRVEEALGGAEDLWTAYRDGRFGRYPAPFLGYFLLLEDCPTVHRPVNVREPHFAVDPVFKGASYARRYEEFGKRLLLERKYTRVCVTLATRDKATQITFPAPELSFTPFAAAMEGYVQTFLVEDHD